MQGGGGDLLPRETSTRATTPIGRYSLAYRVDHGLLSQDAPHRGQVVADVRVATANGAFLQPIGRHSWAAEPYLGVPICVHRGNSARARLLCGPMLC